MKILHVLITLCYLILEINLVVVVQIPVLTKLLLHLALLVSLGLQGMLYLLLSVNQIEVTLL